MAPARALALAWALASPAAAAGGAPVSVVAPSSAEVALATATAAYKRALDRYNGFVVLNGSVQNEEAVELHAAKEAARRAMVRAERAAGKRHAPVQPQDGPLAVPPAAAPEAAAAVAADPTAAVNRDIRRVRRGFVALAGLAGSGLLAWGAVGWWARRPRTLKCPGCGRKLKVPGRGLKARCPKCTVVFDA
jgi:hypothetical protein